MKKTLLSIILIVFVNNIIFSQNNKITYKKKYTPLVKKELKNKQNSYSLIIDDALKKSEEINYILVFNKKEASFSIEESVEKDNISISDKLAKELGGGSSVIYMNIPENTIIEEKEIGGELFIIKTKINDIKWIVSNTQKTIGKYSCFKATTSISVETIKTSVRPKKTNYLFA